MQRQSVRTRILGALALILFAARVFSQETLLTEKKAFSLLSYTNHCDVIYMGTRSRGALGGLVLGSTATKLLHIANVPVTLFR